MRYQQTSLLAWNEAKETLGERQEQVLEVITNFPGCDNLFISQKTGLPINSVTPRVQELRFLGKVRESGKYKNLQTGRLTMRWEVSQI